MAQVPRFVPRAGEEPIRGHVRASGHDRVNHGLFLPTVEEGDPEHQWHRELHAWQQVMPDSARFTHVTGVRLYRWAEPKLPEQVPVFAAIDVGDPRPRREGLICSRLTRTAGTNIRQGFPVEDPEEVLLRCARDLGVLDLVILVDSALRLGDLDVARMEALLKTRRPGVRVLASAYKLSCQKRESAMESVLGVFHAAMEIVVDVQVEIHDDDGRLLGRVDSLVRGTDQVHEYDGGVHRDKVQHRADLRRERSWSNTSYRRKGYSLDDLLNHAAVVMHEMDRDLGRPHVQQRLDRWRTLIRESLYDEPGRARIVNRWRRAMGVVQWS
jgi:hypothetical protein